MATTAIKKTYVLGGNRKINRFGYGAMQLTGPGVYGEVHDKANAIKVLQEAVANGVDFIDTAEAYGPGLNESLIADALYPYPKDLLIATKGGFERPGPGQWIPNGDPAFIQKCIDGSLKRLKVDAIDLWQLHRVDPKTPLEKTLEPVVKAVEDGKIKRVGLSEVTIQQLEHAQKILPIVSVQNLFNLSERKWDSMIEYTASRNIAFIPWYPLASGPDTLGKQLQKIAAEKQATPAQIALAWLFMRSPNIILIPGTSSVSHLKENLKAMDIILSQEEFDSLDKG